MGEPFRRAQNSFLILGFDLEILSFFLAFDLYVVYEPFIFLDIDFGLIDLRNGLIDLGLSIGIGAFDKGIVEFSDQFEILLDLGFLIVYLTLGLGNINALSEFAVDVICDKLGLIDGFVKKTHVIEP